MATSQIAEVSALGYKHANAQTSATTRACLGRCPDLFCDDVHLQSKAASCSRRSRQSSDRRMARPIAGVAGRLAVMSLCRITFISSVGQNVMERAYPNLWDFGKATRAGRSMRSRRGQRPRLQRSGNANSSIIFFAPTRATARNGTTFEIIPSALVWFAPLTHGSMQASLRR